MKVIVLAIKGVKESFRDIKNLAFLLAFPLLFLLLFRVAFGWGPEATETYDIVVIDEDTGEGPWANNEPEWLPYYNLMMGTNLTASEFFTQVILQNHSTAGEFFVEEVLRTAKYEDNETKMFNVRIETDREKGEDMISNDEAVVLVVIPANFSDAIQGAVDQAIVDELRAHTIPANATVPGYAHAFVELVGGIGNYDYSFAASLVQNQVYTYVGTLEATVRYVVGSTLPGGPMSQTSGRVDVIWVSIGETQEFTIFDWQAPGIVVFALMMTAIYVTATLATEVKNKTLQRLRLTKMRAVDLMGGTTLRWLFIGLFQTVILVATIWALGTRVAGDFAPTIAAIFMIAMVAILASISLGLIISAFVDDPEQAANIGTAIVVPMSFLTGAFFPMDVAVAKLLPWTQCADALKQVMLYADYEQALIYTSYALVGAVVLFAVGVMVFRQKRLMGYS